MSKRSRGPRWTEEFVDQLIRIQELKKATKCGSKIEIIAIPRSCPKCKRRSQLFVPSDELCGDCWSKKMIRNWKRLK